jgi:hypothetical protein
MDILKMITDAVTPTVSAKLAGALGLPESAVRKAMAVGVPIVLATLLKRGAASGGTDAIGAALGSMGKNPLGSLGAFAGSDASQVTAAAQGGSDMLGSLLGVGASGGLAKTLAGYIGVDEKAAGPLLGLVGATAMGGLKTAADRDGLDAAGVLKMLGGQQDKLSAAIPADLGKALSSSGLLPRAADVANASRAAATTATKQASSGGMMKWVLAAAAAVVVVWLAGQYMGGGSETATDAATAAADALVVDGVNLGDSLTGVLGNLTTTLAGVTDAASATAAATALSEADTALGSLETAAGSLSTEGKSALGALVAAALPALRTSIDGLIGNESISAVLKPTLDSILAKLTTLAG